MGAKKDRAKNLKETREKNWAKIKAEYCTSEITLSELCKKYDIAYSTINSRCTRDKWKATRQRNIEKIKKTVDDAILEKATEQEIDRRIKANEIHNELFDKGLQVVNLLLDSYMEDLKDGKKRTPATAKNIELLMQAVASAQKGQRVSLNITEEQSTTLEPTVTVIKGLDKDKI